MPLYDDSQFHERRSEDFSKAGRAFENIVGKLFAKLGYLVEQPSLSESASDQSVDLVVVDPKDNQRLALQIKLHRSRKLPTSLLMNAIASLEKAQKLLLYDQVGLVISTELSEDSLDQLKSAKPHLRIFDLDWLIRTSKGDTQLQKELAELLIRASPFTSPLLQDPRIYNLWQATRTPQKALGQSLIEKLLATEAGREDAQEFEKLCTEALEYLFKADLDKWTPQKPLADGLHRSDLVARILAPSDFWGAIKEQFGSRFMLFEFKNYTEPIRQGEIYTTEKYLFPKALRAVALVIARNGLDDGAKEAAKGALREAGKLILGITLNELCEMLRMKDRGDSPEDYLAAILDEYLLNIGR